VGIYDISSSDPASQLCGPLCHMIMRVRVLQRKLVIAHNLESTVLIQLDACNIRPLQLPL